jgi:putative molybdopterin biosynthesis protein
VTNGVNDRRLLSVGEVATRLGVSRLTVWRLIDRGEIPALRVGRQLRLDPEELNAWLYAVQGSPAVTPSRRGADNPERGDPQGAVDSPAQTGVANG